MDNHTKMSDEDYKIEKDRLLQDIAGLCTKFLKKTGDNMISIGIESKMRDLTVDSNGNRCRGAIMELDCVSWYTDPDEDPFADFYDDPDDDE